MEGKATFLKKSDFHRELFLTINRFPEANMKVFSDNQKRLCIFSLEEVIKISKFYKEIIWKDLFFFQEIAWKIFTASKNP